MKLSLRSVMVCVAALLCLGLNQPSDAATPPHQSVESIAIPGPLRSFLRMSGISQEIPADDVLPMLARNVSLLGYQAGRETEFLILLNRYVHQARELAQLSDSKSAIRVASCDQAGRLIEILGYRLQGACGQRNATLMTADPERAFLTIDSGFPLTTLEQSLQRNAPFNYPYPQTQVPIFFSEKDWANLSLKTRRTGGADLLDLLLNDQDIDRVYWGLAKCDQETRSALEEDPGLGKLASLAPVFNLYGSGINIHAKKVLVPGSGAEKDWEDLVGAPVGAPGDFVVRLLSKDRGWLAAYYDVMTRLNQVQQTRLTQGTRLKHLYEAYRSTQPKNGAADGIFPRNAQLLVLFTSVKWDANGDPSVREGLGAWEDILSKKIKTNTGSHEWPKQSRRFDTPVHFLEMLTASTNLGTDSGPVQIFLMLEAMNAGRPEGQRLSDNTEKLIADRLAQFNHWFAIFAEFPELDDASIAHFVSAADHTDSISNPTLRANALGALQANIGLWQILARQGQIRGDQLNKTWESTIQPFVAASSSVQVFEAARGSLQSLLTAAAGNPNLTQDQIVDLLAGPPQKTEEGQRVHAELARRIHSVLDDQRLVSLDTLFGLYDGLTDMAHGAAIGDQLLPLAGNLREFEMPRPIFTGSEKIEWSPVVYTSRHAELQVRTDLTKILKSPGSPQQLEAARGQLTPFLRDSLVGLNYAYYEPPGAEVLHNNPLFVRSHDFSSVSVQGVEQIWGAPGLIGVGATAGGGAYLMGSLADLPYALASTEQDFIAPKNVQALIWKETVPDLLVDAVVPRWWAVSPSELHSAALYQRAGDELLTASATNPALRAKVLDILSDRMAPDRLEKAAGALKNPDSTADLVAHAIPANTFYLAVEFRKKYPDEATGLGPANRELDDLVRKDPADADSNRVSADFGTPHPAMLLSNSRTLLCTKPLPAFSGNASRLLAESWESNNLYWARLADEMGYSPVTLNILVPALTRHMVANIFASNIDDWPALQRAMQQTGNDFRQGKITLQASNTVARQ
jgi:hypothetical protein